MDARDARDRDPTAPDADVQEQARDWEEPETSPVDVTLEPDVPEADALDQSRDVPLDDDHDR